MVDRNALSNSTGKLGSVVSQPATCRRFHSPEDAAV